MSPVLKYFRWRIFHFH